MLFWTSFVQLLSKNILTVCTLSFINYKYTKSISLSIGIANHIRYIKAIDALPVVLIDSRPNISIHVQNRQISLQSCRRIWWNSFENSCIYNSIIIMADKMAAQFDVSFHFDMFENRFLEYTASIRIRKIHKCVHV